MEWVSVNLAVPRQGRIVLVLAPECVIIGSTLTGMYFEDTKTWTVYDFAESKLDELVTHWMPLPEPPKELQ